MIKSTGIIAWFLIIGALSFAPPAACGTLRVPEDYANLSQAVAVAHAGDTILIEPGDYPTNAVIDKSLILRGVGDVILQGTAPGRPVLLVDGHGSEVTVEIRGVEITDAQRAADAATRISADGIFCRSGASLKLDNCVIRDNAEAGLRVQGNSRATVTACTIAGNWDGIVLADAAQADISASTIDDNFSYGISVRDRARLVVSENEIRGNKVIGVYGESVVTVHGNGNTMRENGVDLVGNVAGGVMIPGMTPRVKEIIYPNQHYRSIQQAIDALLPGGTLVLNPGDYPTCVTITKQVTITAAGAVTMRAEKLGAPVISVVGNGDLTLTGVTVMLGNDGIIFGCDARGVITNCTVKDNLETGIHVRDRATVKINGCVIYGNYFYGVFVAPSGRVNGSGNHVFDNGTDLSGNIPTEFR